MSPRVELVVRSSDRIVPLAPGVTLTVGRTPQCDLQVDDPSVSRRHCTIELLDGLLRVIDLDSANGTFINERSVRDATARPGDVLRLGAAVVDIRDPDAGPSHADDDVTVDESEVESVIQRRIEPSSFDWLASSGAADAPPELALLKRAQRHLSTLHRVSEQLAGARDNSRLADATLRTILDVLPALVPAPVGRP